MNRLGVAIMATACCCTLSSSIVAQNTIKFTARNTFVQDAAVNPKVSFFVTHHQKGALVGFAGYAEANEGWGEAYGGLNVAPLPWLFFDIYAGVETFPDWWRLAGDINLSFDKLNWYTLYEYGASGQHDGDFLWSNLSYQANDWLTPTIKTYKFGPTWKIGGGATIGIPKTPLSIAPIVLFNFNSTKVEGEVSLYINF